MSIKYQVSIDGSGFKECNELGITVIDEDKKVYVSNIIIKNGCNSFSEVFVSLRAKIDYMERVVKRFEAKLSWR